MSFSSGPNPFLQSAHGHPAFNPVCLGTKGGRVSDTVVPKQPKPPDKPLTPYIRYSQKVWEQVKTQHPDLKSWEIGRLIGQMWRELPDESKKEHADEYEAEKAKYNEALKSYQSSPAYQTWVAAKARAKAEASKVETDGKKKSQEERDALERSATASTLLSPQKSDGKVCMQPEEDDDSDLFSNKHIALARYNRNHRLINEIFSDTVVPDVRSVVTADRMMVLKKQVQSLTMHQKKLEAELAEIEKFELKKRKFIEESEAFQEELKKMREQSKEVEAMLRCSNDSDNPQFKKLVEQAKEQLRQESKRIRVETPQPLPISESSNLPPIQNNQEAPSNTDLCASSPTPNGLENSPLQENGKEAPLNTLVQASSPSSSKELSS